MALLFEDQRHGNDRVLLKEGTTTGFHSKLIVVPDRGVALAVSYNGLGDNGGARLAGARLVSAFLDTFLPAASTPAGTVAGSVGRYAGTYRTTRTPEADVSRIQALFDTVAVTANADGTLTVTGAPTPDPAQERRRWRQIGPDLFQDENGTDRIAFRTDRHGRVTTMSADQEPSEAYVRLGSLESPARDLLVLLSAWAICAATLLVVPVRAASAWRGGRRLRRRAGPVAAICSAAVSAAATAVLLLLLLDDSSYEGLVTGESVVLALLPVTTGATVVLQYGLAPW